MTREELKSLISECVSEQMTNESALELDDIALAEAELYNALVTESACLAYSSMLVSEAVNEAVLLEGPADEYFDAIVQAQNAMSELKAKEATPEKRQELIHAALKNKADEAKLARANDPDLKKVVQNKAADTVAKDMNKAAGKNIFKNVGGKIVAVFKNSDGTVNKKAVGVAAAGTALAASISAAAIVAHKKKAKEEEKKNK